MIDRISPRYHSSNQSYLRQKDDRSTVAHRLQVGEVPGDLVGFGVLGDDAEGFESVDRILDFAFAAAGVFELLGDRIYCPFPALCSQ